MLSLELLNALEHGWREQQADVISHLRPGLSDEQIDDVTTPLNLRLPAEARLWWGWHDGADPSVGAGRNRELGPGLPFLTLEEAVARCRRLREEAATAWGAQASYWWRPTWFPITEQRGAIRCDCSVPDGAPTPIYWAYSHDNDERGLTRPRVDSFGTMVEWWVDALAAGAWRYQPESASWAHRPDLTPPERQDTGLV